MQLGAAVELGHAEVDAVPVAIPISTGAKENAVGEDLPTTTLSAAAASRGPNAISDRSATTIHRMTRPRKSANAAYQNRAFSLPLPLGRSGQI